MASFVIHGVSVNQSVDTLATKEIYGYYDRELKLNFYFDKNDVSYYNPIDGNDQYWNVDYVYENGIENNFADGNPLKEIYTILKEINSVDANGISSYLILNSNKKQELNKHLYDLNGLTKNNIELKYNVLTVEKNYQPEYLAMAFGLYLDGSAWKVDNYNKNVNYIVDKNFKLAFKDAIQWYEPTVINEVEDFLNMESGDQYILNTDLELENYVPLDVKILEFDGNGHTITIKSFGSFDSADIEMGLFAKIYPNMIVKNVNLVYAGENLYGNYTLGTSYNEYTGTISYLDICNNPNVSYTSARFGGIAAINYGVVTNCVVSGEIVLRASQLESKSASGSGEYGIDFNIGGLVAENTTYTDSANEFDTEYTSGYITHSTSELKIIALANIGGFVHTNNGKIVSCGVDGKASIYGYDAEPGKTIVIEAGGFAVTNNNEISMSYASYNAVSEKKWFGTILEGTMSIKDNSAGFVYNNVGSISDAYVYMGEKGDNSNKFAGFVLTNTGSVTRAYSIINKGDIPGKESAMFAPPGTTNLKDCIEFVNLTNSYSSGFDPAELETVNVSYATYKSWYENHGFAFGDNKNAVWKISSGSTPKLVSTNEMTLKNGFKPLTITKNPDEIVDGVVQSTYKTSYAQYGTKNNPFIIDSLKTWNHIFKENNDLIVMHSYYRIVRDIDFALHGDNPITSTTVFKGNIQGNNMELNNIMLYSTKNLDSLGLFAKLEGANDVQIDNAVRNLKLTTTSVWASSTSSVGVLAGIIEDFNIYNISISHTTNGTMVGQNAVGGLAGVVRGDFDIDQISSNIGANSTRASTVPYYSIYMSKSNGEDVSKNLNNVYYAGSVVGILDGYTRTDYNVNATTRDLITSKYKYNKVRNIVVNGQITLIGDTVGGAFGFVGERVYVQRVDINLSGSLFGYQYSAGLAGENRGVIDGDIKVVLADDVLSRSKFVSAGLVGLNLGGLVRNVEVKANIIKTTSEHNVGGIIGRNIHGTIANAHFDGELFGNYTGGIVAVNYDHEILKMSSAGTGALHDECKTSRNLIPNVFIQYKENGVKIDNFKNLSLSINALNYLINNSRKYYGYLNKVDPSSIEEIIIKSKVYGLVVGLSFNTDNVVTKYNNGCYDIKLTDDAIFINSTLEESETDARYETNLDVDLITSGGTVISITMHDANVIDASKLDISVDRDYIVYLVGAYADAFNSWDKYSSVYFVINNISAPTP